MTPARRLPGLGVWLGSVALLLLGASLWHCREGLVTALAPGLRTLAAARAGGRSGEANTPGVAFGETRDATSATGPRPRPPEAEPESAEKAAPGSPGALALAGAPRLSPAPPRLDALPPPPVIGLGEIVLTADRTPPPPDLGLPPALAAGDLAPAITRPPAATGAASLAALAITPAERREDALVEYLARLAQAEFSVPMAVEPLVVAGQSWLLEYREPSPAREQVVFIVNTVLPALEEVVPKLVANAPALVGLRVPGREFRQCTVHEISSARLVLREQAPHGIMLRTVPWQSRETDTLPLILHLSRVQAAKSTAWSDRRPFLALLLITRNERLLDEALTGLPETAERLDWLALKDRLPSAADEGKAWRLWQRSLTALEQGERTTAYALLREFQGTRGAVRERYRERAETLRRALARGVPAELGGALVREAAENLRREPQAALTRLLLAQARCGRADFPERDRIERLQRQALAALPLDDELARRAAETPLEILVPLAQPATQGIPHLGMRILVALGARAGDLPGRTAAWLTLLEEAARVELGDWAGAQSAAARVPGSALLALPPVPRAAACYARGLVDLRFGTGAEKPVQEVLRQCGREPGGGGVQGEVSLPMVFLLEYGLARRPAPGGLEGYLISPAPLSASGPVELRARLLLDLLSLALERRQTASLSALLPTLGQTPASLAEWGVDGHEQRLIATALAAEAEPPLLATALTGLERHPRGEWLLRLASAAELSRGRVSDPVWLQASEWISLKGETFGPVGAGAVYNLVLLRTGNRLGDGDLTGALATLDWGLEFDHPCLAPYYARLRFAQRGLMLLTGQGGSRELGDLVEAATCANRAEKALSRLYVSEALRARALEAARDSLEVRFWYDWLAETRRLAARSRSPAAVRLGGEALPPPERGLADGLAAWVARQAAGTDPRPPDR